MSRIVRNLLITALALGLCACEPSSERAAADAGLVSSTDWSTALHELQGAHGQIYSFLFNSTATGAEPGLRIDVHDASAAGACARYGPSGALSDDDFWFIQVDLSAARAGRYDIVHDTLDTRSTATPSALVTLLHRSQGEFVAKYHAVAGTVELSTAADLMTWKAGAATVASIRAEFPTHAIQTQSCRGGVDLDSGEMLDSCTCVDSSGVTTTCTPGPGRSECCVDEHSPREVLRMTIHATECPEMCRMIVGAQDLCSQLY